MVPYLSFETKCHPPMERTRFHLPELPELTVLKKEHHQPGAFFAFEYANRRSITKLLDHGHK